MTKGQVLAGMLLVISLPVAITAFNIFTTPMKVINKTLETDNIITSYEWYFDTLASYKARVSQVKQFSDLTKKAKGSSADKYQIETAAMQQSCRDLAQKYNYNSKKLNKKYFKDWSLPGSISVQACEVTQ